MERLIVLMGFVIFLTGCGANTITVKTEVQESLVTVMYCPAPPEVLRPALPIHQMTEEQAKQDGEVAKHYKATIRTLMGYSQELEKSLSEFDKINKAYEEKRKQIEAEVEERKAAKPPTE